MYVHLARNDIPHDALGRYIQPMSKSNSSNDYNETCTEILCNEGDSQQRKHVAFLKPSFSQETISC